MDVVQLLGIRASAAIPVGPQGDVYDRAQESVSRPQSERSERALIRTSEGSKLTVADSMGAARATIDCGACGMPFYRCTCDFGV